MTGQLGNDERAEPGLSALVQQAEFAALLHGLAAGGADRSGSARELGRSLGAQNLMLFLRDPEVGVLLPAPGFPQTLPDGRAWKGFLDRCIEKSGAPGNNKVSHSRQAEWPTERLRPPGGTEALEATGIASGRDIVLVLFGGPLVPDAVAAVVAFLPLVVSALTGERAARVADAQARVARDAAGRAEALAGSLDSARSALSRALDEVRDSRTLLEEQANALQSANEELESQSEELQAINEELEQQSDELRRQMIVAETATKATELARADAERARKAAEDANRSKSEFLASMSHELRTPLNAIGGYVQLIEIGVHGTVTPAQNEALERVRVNQQHLLSLINDVLNFAKIEAGRVEYRRDELRLCDVVAEVGPMIEPQFTTKGLKYEASVPERIVVCADRDKLRQVMLNLLSNAAKFTERGGMVKVDAVEDEDVESGRAVALLSVSDTGCGIPGDKQESIFDPFVQVHRDLTRPHEGAGLGLAISRDLARGMGGDISLHSVEGEGSTFTLRLPAPEQGAPNPMHGPK